MLDTNILIYAFTTDARADIARNLMAAPFVVSVQALNEFANVSRSKLRMDWQDIREALALVTTLASSVESLNIETHSKALDLAQRFEFSLNDAVMLAAAVLAGCGDFVSEDMQDGMLVDGKLTIINPFKA